MPSGSLRMSVSPIPSNPVLQGAYRIRSRTFLPVHTIYSPARPPGPGVPMIVVVMIRPLNMTQLISLMLPCLIPGSRIHGLGLLGRACTVWLPITPSPVDHTIHYPL